MLLQEVVYPRFTRFFFVFVFFCFFFVCVCVFVLFCLLVCFVRVCFFTRKECQHSRIREFVNKFVELFK